MAAYYPEKPTAAQTTAARNFIDGLATLYACSHCAEHFREGMAESPPRVESRAALSVWMCQARACTATRCATPLRHAAAPRRRATPLRRPLAPPASATR